MSVFPRIREELQVVTSLPREEITLESHVYNDLLIDSIEIVELFTALEEAFDLNLPNTVEDSYLETRISGAWDAYKAKANNMMFQHFVVLEFPEIASERVEEMMKLCKKYQVQPFSVGFICAWIVQMLDSEANNV